MVSCCLALNPSAFPQTFRPAGESSACCLPATEVCATPALPSLLRSHQPPCTLFTRPMCVRGRESCARRSGIRDRGCASPTGFTASLLEGWGPRLPACLLLFRYSPYNLVSLLGLQKIISICLGGSTLFLCLSLVSEAACLSSLLPLQMWQPPPFPGI